MTEEETSCQRTKKWLRCITRENACAEGENMDVRQGSGIRRKCCMSASSTTKPKIKGTLIPSAQSEHPCVSLGSLETSYEFLTTSLLLCPSCLWRLSKYPQELHDIPPQNPPFRKGLFSQVQTAASLSDSLTSKN